MANIGDDSGHGDSLEDDEEVPEAVLIDVEVTRDVSLKPPVPITIITGYLGAGKTTLVNYILTAQHGQRIAVILNEFGAELDIERALVKEGEGESASVVEEWVELGNGCICCTTKNAFVQVLEELMLRRDKFDHILLETTGLANPGPVAGVLWVDEPLEASVRLDSIVTVVDARNLERQLGEEREEGAVNEAALQIAFADVIILNKVDLLYSEVDKDLILECNGEANAENQREQREQKKGEDDGEQNGEESNIHISAPAEVKLGLHYDSANYKDVESEIKTMNSVAVEKLEREIRSINSMAKIVKSVRCEVDLCQILQRGSFEPQRVSELEGLLETNSNSGHRHDSSVGTESFWLPGFIDIPKVDHLLGELLWEKVHKSDIYRMKGALCVKNSDKMMVFQAVHELYEIVPGRLWKATEEHCNKIVVIGRNLDRDWLVSSFSNCLLPQ